VTRSTVPAAALAALATALFASPAAAVITLTSSPGAPDPGIPLGYTTVVTFDTAPATGIVNTIFGNVVTAAGNVSGQRAGPAGTPSGGIYQSVGTFSPNTSSSTFDFTNYLGPDRYLTGFSLYWGSVDPANRVEFYNDSNILVQFFLGTNLPASTGNQILSQTNRRVTFNIDGMDRITKVRMLSTTNAFEYDTLAVTDGPMPEPGSWVLMITGFGFIGAAMRRRAQQAAGA
jgi:hypothetical protein